MSTGAAGRFKVRLIAAAACAVLGFWSGAGRGLGIRFSDFFCCCSATGVLSWLLDRQAAGEPPLAAGSPGLTAVWPWACPAGGTGGGHHQSGPGDRTPLPADAVIVPGGGRQRHRAVVVPLDPAGCGVGLSGGIPDIPAVLTGGTGYGEEISRASCMYDYLTGTALGPAADWRGPGIQHGGELRLPGPLLEGGGVDGGGDTVAVVTNDFHRPFGADRLPGGS